MDTLGRQKPTLLQGCLLQPCAWRGGGPNVPLCSTAGTRHPSVPWAGVSQTRRGTVRAPTVPPMQTTFQSPSNGFSACVTQFLTLDLWVYFWTR